MNFRHVLFGPAGEIISNLTLLDICLRNFKLDIKVGLSPPKLLYLLQ